MRLTPDAQLASGVKPPVAISDAFIASVLSPYKEHARYLQSAQITSFQPEQAGPRPPADRRLLTGTATFSIPTSCYIADTGHFNSVEFNICYNQMAYVLLGKSIEHGLLQQVLVDYDERLGLRWGEFAHYQLSSMLIVKLESKFKGELNARDFQGDFTLQRVMSTRGVSFLHTEVSFSERTGEMKASGSVLLAFSAKT